jgi:YidC/Oxa1 family membrane protein insertase
MEKRFLVTMLVMTVFYIAVTYIYPLIYPPPPKSAVSSNVTAESVSPAVSNGSPNGSVAISPSADPSGQVSPPPVVQGDPWAISSASDITSEPKDIVIKTEDFQATITENGGRLKSFTLNKYKKDKIDPKTPDSPQEMVNVRNNWDLPWGLYLAPENGDGRVSLTGLRFVADRDSFSVSSGRNEVLTLTAQTNVGLTVTKVFTFSGDGYLIGQAVKLVNNSNFHYQGRLGQTMPIVAYSLRPTRYGAVAGYVNQKLFSESASSAGKELAELQRPNIDWLGYMDQHFLSAFVFERGADGLTPDGLRLGTEVLPDNAGFRIFQSRPLSLPPGGAVSFTQNYYSGPKDSGDLKAAGHYLDFSLDYGWFTVLAKPLIWLLRNFYSLVGNYGIAIILVTIIIKIALWPLTAKSYKSMKEMQKLQPLMTKIREKYKDNRQLMQKEIMELYRAYHVSPLGGCLPMLLQIPFFIAFYRVLDYALELRGAPFMLWIHDLSVPDRLFYFAFKLPLLDEPTGIPVLTLLMGATMIWQQKMAPSMGDPMQAKMMMLMPIVFIVVLLNMPSGLVLYWLVNNILSIFQQKLINRQAKPTSKAVAKPLNKT